MQGPGYTRLPTTLEPGYLRWLCRPLSRWWVNGARRQTRCKRLCGFLLLLLLSSQGVAEVKLSVNIEGVEGELLENVQAYLSLQQRKSEKSLTERWVKILHEDAPFEIRAALEPFGYYNVEIEDSLKQVDGAWTARYKIDLGKPVHVSSLDLRYLGEGARAKELTAAIRSFPLKIGDVMDHKRYESARAALVDAAMQLGYAKAEPTVARVVVKPQANTAAVTLHVDTGPRYYIGEVRFHQDFLNEKLLRKTITLKKGDPYRNGDVLTFQQGLQAADWASVVTVEPRFDEAVDGLVPLDVTMQPSKRNRYALGFGYETDVGPRVSMRWVHRRLNQAGHHSEVFVRLSPVRRTVRGAYFIPVRQPITDRLSMAAEYEYEETSDTRRNTLDGELAFLRRSLDDRLFYKSFLELRSEDYQVRGDPSVKTNLLSIGAAARLTELEPVLFPRRGRHFDIELRGASSAIFSDTSYLRLRFGTKYLLPAGRNGRVRLHGEVGTAAVEFFELYPTSLRFFAGGDSSVRGYEYKSLGPEDENGNVVGGENLLLLSTEYDHRIKPHWVVAGFVDAGNAFNDQFDGLAVGAGAGFRWLSNFGSLRLDLAWPVSEDDVRLAHVVLHLGFGAAL